MLERLKNHPFAVEAFFESSVVITYAVPKEELEGLIPESLSLDLFEDKWAFVAIALVETKNLRPKSFPAFFGNDFLLVGYRIFVRYTNSKGKRLRGLYILKSQSDKMKMVRRGNIFSHYHYQHIDLRLSREDSKLRFYDPNGELNVHIQRGEAEEKIDLPQHSPFPSWKEARRFAGPLPFTFSYLKDQKEMLIIEGVRQNWVPKAVKILEVESAFIHSLNLKGAVLANAFVIDKIPYWWKKGVRDPWKP